ncbi:hypothetical protein AB3U99_11665 [Niallia sp. JL1B1071]|uniref:hypothetical protein n=1 Tax=Niallia tiangongensis TaxID=3237105 RepID=UPI0037DCBD61
MDRSLYYSDFGISTFNEGEIINHVEQSHFFYLTYGEGSGLTIFLDAEVIGLQATENFPNVAEVVDLRLCCKGSLYPTARVYITSLEERMDELVDTIKNIVENA